MPKQPAPKYAKFITAKTTARRTDILKASLDGGGKPTYRPYLSATDPHVAETITAMLNDTDLEV